MSRKIDKTTIPFLENAGYGKGTNFSRDLVASLMLQYADSLVKNINYDTVLAVVHRKNEYGKISYCKDDETNCDLCRFSGIPMQGNSVCEKCYDRLKSNEYYR